MTHDTPRITRLSVNINKVATLRNTRTIGIPSVPHAARLCLDAGADGITIHPRPDERHIRARDVDEVAELMRDYPDREFNIEGNPFHGLLDHVRRVRPTQCTLVPDAVNAFTSNEGWDFVNDVERLAPVVKELREIGCRVSLFADGGAVGLENVARLGAERIELYTEPYASAFEEGQEQAPAGIAPFVATAREAERLGIGVNAGHDLNRANLPFFLSLVPNTLEVSIGHALIADALEFGLSRTVQLYKQAIRSI